MSLLNYSCDYCGRPDVLDGVIFYTGDERINQYWDGECRLGSQDYFKDLDDETLTFNIDLSVRTLRQDPPSEDDTLHVAQKKSWISQEMLRGMQELSYRIEES
jgi:hypothetical protein